MSMVSTWLDAKQVGGRTFAVVAVLAAALIGFEIFNFDTTRFALHDILGGLRFGGIEWATILAFAFCAIDFAGLVRLSTPQQGWDEPKEVWLLTGAWLVGATMNAFMTWYAVALALERSTAGISLLTRQELLLYAPVFIAILVWLTRILFIGSISVAGDHLLHADKKRSSGRQTRSRSRSQTNSRYSNQNRYDSNGSNGVMGQPLRESVPEQPSYQEDYFN